MGPLERYLTQRARWPVAGRHVVAQYDDARVVVYQAFAPSIARAAVAQGRFGEGFSLSRMSWIKPNFLWMMFRAGWATKASQEAVLAVTLTRAGFDEILAGAVHASHVPEVYGDRASWQRAVQGSDVRLQWDPDHAPEGAPVTRRAVQLGLRDAALRRYVNEWTVGIEDITDFVRAQHRHVCAGDLDALETPREDVYPVSPAVAARLQVSPWPAAP